MCLGGVSLWEKGFGGHREGKGDGRCVFWGETLWRRVFGAVCEGKERGRLVLGAATEEWEMELCFGGDHCGKELGQLCEGEGVFWGDGCVLGGQAVSGRGAAALLWWHPMGMQKEAGALGEEGEYSGRVSPASCSKQGQP